jgi:predicted Fe-Mo cluster-binding NifX family protein
MLSILPEIGCHEAAFTVWNLRIAPLFDVARRIHVVETGKGRIVNQFGYTLVGQVPSYKVLKLAEIGVRTLICGAISNALQNIVRAYDIELIGFVNGDLGQVIEAWQNGTLHGDAFLLPGCKGHNAKRYDRGDHDFAWRDK